MASTVTIHSFHLTERHFNRFLKAKVTILQQELDLSHKDNVKHLDQLAKFGEQQKKIEAARDQSSNKVNSMKTQIEKLQQQNAEVELKSKVRAPISQ